MKKTNTLVTKLKQQIDNHKFTERIHVERMKQLEIGLKNWTDYGNNLKKLITLYSGFNGDADSGLLALKSERDKLQASVNAMRDTINQLQTAAQIHTGNFKPESATTSTVSSVTR